MKNKQMESLTDEKKKFSHDFLKPENATESKYHHKSPSKETAFGMGLEQEGSQSTPCFPPASPLLLLFLILWTVLLSCLSKQCAIKKKKKGLHCAT